MIRLARIQDLERIVAIYNQAVPHKNATADLLPVQTEQRKGWFSEHNPESFPIYVMEEDGRVAGWCSLSPYRGGRLALKDTAEVTFYVDYAVHGRGVGKALLKHALEDCARIGKRVLFAIVLEKNKKSIHLLEKAGFEKWGTLPDVADFDGELCAHVYMGKKALCD